MDAKKMLGECGYKNGGVVHKQVGGPMGSLPEWATGQSTPPSTASPSTGVSSGWSASAPQWAKDAVAWENSPAAKAQLQAADQRAQQSANRIRQQYGPGSRYGQLANMMRGMPGAPTSVPASMTTPSAELADVNSKMRAMGRKRGGHITAAARHALPTKDFALSGERYPIDTKARARNALARGAQNASESEQATIKRKVKRKFPSINVGGEDD